MRHRHAPCPPYKKARSIFGERAYYHFILDPIFIGKKSLIKNGHKPANRRCCNENRPSSLYDASYGRL